MGIQRPRINNFQGSIDEYIVYLESIVLQRNTPPPSPTRSDVRGEAIDGSVTDKLPYDAIKFIIHRPEAKEDDAEDCCSARPGKRKRVESRWEREMNEMTSRLTPEDWASRRKSVGLSSQAGIIMGLDMLIQDIKPQPAQNTHEADLSAVTIYPANAVLQLLNTFAVKTAALKIQETFTTQIFSFQVFVFVSLCCVALQNGVDPALVDQTMQICISKSSTKNLARLRNGALWVNRVMFELAADGYDHLAYELFVLCELERPLSPLLHLPAAHIDLQIRGPVNGKIWSICRFWSSGDFSFQKSYSEEQARTRDSRLLTFLGSVYYQNNSG